jgi:hypothetical protein
MGSQIGYNEKINQIAVQADGSVVARGFSSDWPLSSEMHW